MKWYHEQYFKSSLGKTERVLGKHKTVDSKVADNNIFYCKWCKRSHETTWTSTVKETRYYTDFPRYKKGRKTCKGCIRRKIHMMHREYANKRGLTWIDNQKNGKRGYYKTRFKPESEIW